MDRAVVTSVDGDLPPKREKIVPVPVFVLWTIGTWIWRLLVLAGLCWGIWLGLQLREIGRDATAQLSAIKDKIK